MATTAVRGTRRTQAQRRTATRAALVEAAITLLVDEGYSAATNRRICELAGVSQGAFSHHFPQQADLMAAALEALSEDRVAAYEAAIDVMPSGLGDRVLQLTDMVWQDALDGPFRAIVRLWVAASEDPELRARLAPVERAVRDRVARAGRRLLLGGVSPEDLDRAVRRSGAGIDDLDALVGMLTSAMTGMAFTMAFEPRVEPGPGTRMEEQRRLFERMVISLLDPG